MHENNKFKNSGAAFRSIRETDTTISISPKIQHIKIYQVTEWIWIIEPLFKVARKKVAVALIKRP